MMAYNNNFVATVKQNGSILRETNGEIHLPFGSEYSILLKNLNSRKALVTVSVDGRDIGGELIIDANSDVEIERFIDGDLSSGYRFKFIEKTEKVRKHRGNKVSDGLIRIEYKFEKEQPVIVDHHHHHHDHHHHDHHDYWPKRWPYDQPIWYGSNTSGDNWSDIKYGSTVNDDVELCDSGEHAIYSCNVGSSVPDSMVKGTTRSAPTKMKMMANVSPQNEDGITVEGGDSSQHFHYGSIGECETQSSVITLQLKGTTENHVPIKRPITVKTKLICKSCGTSSRSSVKFCRECGTRLI